MKEQTLTHYLSNEKTPLDDRLPPKGAIMHGSTLFFLLLPITEQPGNASDEIHPSTHSSEVVFLQPLHKKLPPYISLSVKI